MGKKYNWEIPHKFHAAAVVEIDKEVKAFGMLRPILEAIFIGEGSKRQVVESLSALLLQAEIDAELLGYKEIHVFSKDKDFISVLTTHFQFEEIEGKFLVLRLEK